MRVFTAIECPTDLKDKLAPIQKELVGFGKLKAVEYENLHVTLKFFGDVGGDRLGKLEAELDSIKVSRFDASVKGVGVFPDPANVRIVWAGIDKGSNEIIRLNELIEVSVSSLGFQRDTRFHPHITLGRVNGKVDKSVIRDFIGTSRTIDFGSFKPESFVLMASKLTSDGPIYEVIKRMDFI